MRHPVWLPATLSSILLAWCACALALDTSLNVNRNAHSARKIRNGFFKGEIRALPIFLVLIVVALVPFAPMFAQSLTGTLRGVVLDQQGRVVPDATITLTSDATGASQRTTSSSAGVYTIPNLAAGSYMLKVDAKGFASYLKRGILLLTSQVTDVTLNLEVAGATETVIVQSGANLVQSESSQISGTFEGKCIPGLIRFTDSGRPGLSSDV